ncbi:glycerol kinase GlpK [Phycisphaerales bacterium AB-hyl4]|uniref:Glycerol kinase n=1 Tax=Natronomicrosphaera hydrolytica TaxID=3242702 RepID=A0ABV4UB90_9BACT
MTTKTHVLALDQGTTSSRAIVFDQQGGIVARAQHEFEQLFPRPGWVEHNPEAIWRSQLRAAREALDLADLSPGDIAGVGITNQRETTLIWDRATGEPIANAIVWQDRRTADLCDRLRNAGFADTFQQKTGLVLDAYFSGTKINWLLEHVDGARERAQRGELAFGTVDTWLIWKLTVGRVHITDATNASRTLLYNIRTGQWDDELLEHLSIPRELLPDVRPSSEVYGETDPELLGTAVPIAGVAGDQQAALFGQMCMTPGMAKNTYGTGCFMLLNTGNKPRTSKHNLLTTIAWQLGDEVEYALEGSIFIGGAVVQWLRDGLHMIDSSSEIEKLAASVDDNGGVYLVPAFAGLGAPHWDPYARGTLVGLTRGTTAGHIARAALEAIAFQTADVLEAMHADAGMDITELRVDGGAAANDLLMQFQADVLRVPTVRPKVTETTAAGAAYLAGLATGVWTDRKQIAAQWQVDRRFEPTMSDDRVHKLRERWLEAVKRSRGWEPTAG